jgi:NAD(P)-dependent dehydrogenase (short-subunit alcohol dehydrogenase family)
VHTLQNKQALVVGGSRGFGRGIVSALLDEGMRVHVVARDEAALCALQAELGESLTVTAADATDPVVAGQLLDAIHPNVLVLNAGAAPLLRPFYQQTWEAFSRNWDVDVKIAFHWLREALQIPLEPGSAVVVTSSGAALRGSPVSGGYAGAKATVRFLAEYAADESDRAGLDIHVTTVLPGLTPATELGKPAVTAYARRSGVTEAEFVARMGEPLTPKVVGKSVVRLLTDPDLGKHRAFTLLAAGLKPLD